MGGPDPDHRAESPAPPPAERPVPIKSVPVRHYGRWVSAALVLVVVGAVVYAFGSTELIEWGLVPEYLFEPAIIGGVGNTLLVSVLSMAVGVVLGVLFAVLRLSGNPVTGAVAGFYIWFFRGTPVLVQLLIWFNLGLVFQTFTIPGIYSEPMKTFMTPFLAALLGLGINEGAYMAEIVRAGIASVDRGQTEAAQALGMSSAKTMRRIVLPQAMRVIVPPTGNEFINLLKTSSLAMVIAYEELMRRSENVYTQNLKVVELLFVASIWYLVVTTVFSVGQYYLERRFGRGSDIPAQDDPVRRVIRSVLTVRHSKEGSA